MNWLLLRGLGREQRHWGNFVPVLEERLNGGRVLTLDLPGAGERHLESSPLTIRGITKNVREEFLTRRGDGAWCIVGMSLGGMVAMEWLRLFPEDFARLVLINTSARNAGHPLQRMRPWAVGQMARIAREKDPLKKEHLVLEMTALNSREWAEPFASYVLERPISVRTTINQLAAAMSFQAPRTIPCPVRLLVGSLDRMVSPVCSAKLAQLWGAEIIVHPTASHDLALDDPTWTAEQIASFGS